MNAKTALPRLLISLTLLGGLLAWTAPAAQAADATSPITCAFGYTLQTGLASNWIEIHTSYDQVINFESKTDDGVVHFLDLGFYFPFFENLYNDAYISTNGFLAFKSYQSAFPGNTQIPLDYAPDNLVAAFWDDLTLTPGGSYPNGTVYFKKTGSAPNRQAIFEWYQVTRLGAPDAPVTFEIILNENGDINLNYESMSGALDQATVGIEDIDGVDGIQAYFNSAGLGSNQSYKLIYPGDGARVKAKPLYQGGFLTDGMANLPFTVVNTGYRPDSFQFSSVIQDGGPGWSVSVIDEQGKVVTSTPSLYPRVTFKGFLRILAPKDTPVGSHGRVALTMTSTATPAKTFTISFDSAVPAPFAILYVDSSTAYARYILPHYQVVSPIFPNFTGSSLAIARLSGLNYFLAWENTGSNANIPYGNIRKTAMGPGAGIISEITNLVDNSTHPYTMDGSTAIAYAPDRTVGIAFVRLTLDNTNVYFARLDTSGSLLGPPINLTNETSNAHEYSRPSITVTNDNKFVITWETVTHLGGSATAHDISLAVMASNGGSVFAAHAVTNSQTSGENYSAPSTALLQNGNILLAYLANQPGMQSNQLRYTFYHPADPAGNTVEAPVAIPGGASEGPHITVLKNGNLLVAWAQEPAVGVAYLLFNPQGTVLNAVPWVLAGIEGRKIKNVSVTGVTSGEGVLTWVDEGNEYGFYALVASNGSQITAPMAFLRSDNLASPNLILSSSGRGIAPLENIMFSFFGLIKKAP